MKRKPFERPKKLRRWIEKVKRHGLLEATAVKKLSSIY